MRHFFRFLFADILIILATEPTFAQWVQVTGGDIDCIAADSSSIFVSGLINDREVIISTDDGNSWTVPDAGLTSEVRCILLAGSSIFAGTYNGGVLRSTDRGKSWSEPQQNLPNRDVNCLAVSGSAFFAGTATKYSQGGWGGSVYVSTDSCRSWTAINAGLTDTTIQALLVKGTEIFTGTWLGGICRTTNNGESWDSVNTGITGLTNLDMKCFAVSDSSIFAGGGGGVYRSTNNGASWTLVHRVMMGIFDYNEVVYALAVSGRNIFSGESDGGLYLSTDNGSSWNSVNEGLQNYLINSLVIKGSYLFAGTWSNGVWKRPLSEMITDVEEKTEKGPTHFSLSQNYPNPFNPTTVISYHLPTNSHVLLEVYDVLGREVGTLVNERQSEGDHSVKFSASNLASGVYFCFLQAGTYHDTKKLVLLK